MGVISYARWIRERAKAIRLQSNKVRKGKKKNFLEKQNKNSLFTNHTHVEVLLCRMVGVDIVNAYYLLEGSEQTHLVCIGIEPWTDFPAYQSQQIGKEKERSICLQFPN